MLLAGVAQHARFQPFRAFCVGPCSGKAQYLGGLPKGHRAFPSIYSIMQEVSLPQIGFSGARDVWPPVRCLEYVVNSMVHSVGDHVAGAKCIASHRPISQKAKLRIKKAEKQT
jgi:hypothetical protein